MKLPIQDSFDLFYEVKGSGIPLLLLHGFTGSHCTWDPFVKEWQDQYQLILVDLVGHNKSQAKPLLDSEAEPYTMETMSRALDLLLTHLGLEQTAVLGYSMGGRLALYFALHYQQRVMGLMLESASPGLKLETEREARRQSDRALADQILSLGVAHFVKEWEAQPIFQTQMRLPTTVQEAVRRERLNQTAQGLAGSLIGMGTGAQPSLWDQLQELHLPVWLVVGEWDSKFCQLAKDMSEQLHNARIIETKHSGHAVHVEQIDFFGKLVKSHWYHELNLWQDKLLGKDV